MRAEMVQGGGMIRIEGLRYDARLALRQVSRSPGFFLAIAATLALGIGATTLIFSVVHGVVLRPLPVPDLDRVMRFYSTSAATTSADESSPTEFAALRRHAGAFEALAAIETRGFTISAGVTRAQEVIGIRTNPDSRSSASCLPECGKSRARSTCGLRSRSPPSRKRSRECVIWTSSRVFAMTSRLRARRGSRVHRRTIDPGGG
jgi:hypothetical protein